MRFCAFLLQFVESFVVGRADLRRNPQPSMANLRWTSSKRLKLLAHRCLRAVGLEIRRTQRAANERIMGSFPPHREHSVIGRAENYFIHDGYRHRAGGIYYDDTENSDEWQDEVYKFAREVFDERELKTVCDVGCGSAYKLLKHFRDRSVIGLDVAETCVWLKRQYPHLTWLELDFKDPPSLQADLTIAADVIEHSIDPDYLLSYLATINSEYVILSTPDRNLLRAGTHDGPPRNPAHMREWSFAEFEAYVASRFHVLEHFISNSAQGTQCLLCTTRSAR